MEPFLSYQQRVREEREAKRATMDGRHDFILSTVAERLGIKQDDAEEFMLDDDQVPYTFLQYSSWNHDWKGISHIF